MSQSNFSTNKSKPAVRILIKKTGSIFTPEAFAKIFCKSIKWEFIGSVYECIVSPGEYIITDGFGNYEFIDTNIFEVKVENINEEEP